MNKKEPSNNPRAVRLRAASEVRRIQKERAYFISAHEKLLRELGPGQSKAWLREVARSHKETLAMCDEMEAAATQRALPPPPGRPKRAPVT